MSYTSESASERNRLRENDELAGCGSTAICRIYMAILKKHEYAKLKSKLEAKMAIEKTAEALQDRPHLSQQGDFIKWHASEMRLDQFENKAVAVDWILEVIVKGERVEYSLVLVAGDPLEKISNREATKISFTTQKQLPQPGDLPGLGEIFSVSQGNVLPSGEFSPIISKKPPEKLLSLGFDVVCDYALFVSQHGKTADVWRNNREEVNFN